MILVLSFTEYNTSYPFRTVYIEESDYNTNESNPT